MYIEQPHFLDITANVNKSELTFLVNRYIIDTYSVMLKNKTISKKEIKVGDKTVNIVELFGTSSVETDIPDLEFPFYSPEDSWIVIDYRKNYSYDKKTDTLTERRTTDLNFAKTRGYLTGIWCAGGVKELMLLSLPHVTFANWVGDLIGNKFGLDPLNKGYVTTLAFIYYERLALREDKIPNDEFDRLSVKYRHLGFSPTLLAEVYPKTLGMFNLNDFCETLYDVTDASSLSRFDVGVLYTISQTGWMGINNKINIGVALSYPPIWITMCNSSLINNLYQRTTIGNLIQTLGKRGKGDSFLKEMNNIIENHIEGV